MSALDARVREASLAEGTAAPRRSFTASQRAGVLAMRRGAVPWQFSVALLRAGLALAAALVAKARVREVDGHRELRFDLRLACAWSDLDLAGLLEASLRDDPRDDPRLRWRSLLGAAINGALATDPRWLELHTPVGGRRWAFDAGAPPGEDPYALQRIPSDVEAGGFSLRMAHAEGVAAVWARWTGRAGPEDEVARRWADALGVPIEALAVREGVAAARPPAAGAIALGSQGRWWPRPDGGLFLRRDGVRIADFGAQVRELGGLPLHGDVEAPSVALDIDGQTVREDAALHELIAWMQAPASDDVETVRLEGGTSCPVESLRAVDEVVFTWPHRLTEIQGQGAVVVNPLTPAQVQRLRERTPASIVPASLLRSARGLQRVDLTSLHQGSIGPIALGEVRGDSISAFVHRHPVADQGRVQVHGFGRVLIDARASELPGVTVIGALEPRGEDLEPASDHADAIRTYAESRGDVLTAAVLEAIPDLATRFRVPWFAHRWANLSPIDLELRYAPHADGVRLSWRDDPLLTTVVAREGDGTARTVADALERLRDAGGVVVAEGSGRWQTLESSVPIWTPWRLTSVGSELLVRVLSDAALWRMPMVAEAELRPCPLASQAHVRLEADRAAELRASLRSVGRVAERARCALLAHALWARATHEDAFGLDALPLLSSFDPQSAQPRRLVSVLDVAGGAFAGVVPRGAAHRDLGSSVLEVTPAVAFALVELGLVSSSTVPVRTAPRRPSSSASQRRRVWLRQRVVHPDAVGALLLAEGPGGVEIWEGGLRSQTLRLPPPYGAVSGRVWMQQGRHSTQGLSRLLLQSAQMMADEARRARLLSVPGSSQARALEAFLEAIRAQPQPPPQPPRIAPVLGSDRLAATLRFALGRAVTVEVSRVSWALVRDDENLEEIRVGGLHPLIRAAREDGAERSAIGVAALAILLALSRSGRLDRVAYDEAAARVLAALE
ncbi:MAG: hypothetical protein ACE37F_07560 [Nannocystaceae bacterium]|nr:hypothetical protein [bacterium]